MLDSASAARERTTGDRVGSESERGPGESESERRQGGE